MAQETVSTFLDKHPLGKAKVLYFFYEAIAKSLPGYLASYYKHTLLLSPHQVSILVAARYFAVLIGSPILGSIADKLNRFRNFLVITLIALLATYLIVPIVEPIDGFNCRNHLHNNIISASNFSHNHSLHLTTTRNLIKKTKIDPIKGHYHGDLMFGLFYSWPFEAWEYEETDDITKKVFITLLLVTLVGEFFASPSETFIDFYTLQALKSERNKFGWQVLPGLVGWMIVSTVFLFLQWKTKNYSQDFCHVGHIINSTPYLFVVYGLICICILLALLLKYNSNNDCEQKEITCSCSSIVQAKCLKAFMLLFKRPAYVAFAFAVIFSGFGVGTKTLFIYSYIKDLGGSPVTYFAILVVNFVSNFIALLASPWLIKKYGHENLIACGLFVNGITFVTYSVIENPMMMMLVEPFDGICSSLSWVTILTYVGCPPNIGAALQGLVHGLYRGLGVAIGYFIVSVFILRYGYLALFIGLGLTYFMLFGIYICVVHVWPSPSIAQEYTQYTLLFENKEDVDVTDSESEVSTRLTNDNAELLDTSFLK